MRASIPCPRTGEEVTFDLPTDAPTVSKCWRRFVRPKCPHCGDRHAVAFRDAYVDGVLTSLGAGGPHSMFTLLPEPPKPKTEQERAPNVVRHHHNVEEGNARRPQ